MQLSFDILFVADPRFKGGASTGLASEIRASRACGLTCGLIMVKGPLLRKTRPLHAELRALIGEGLCQVVDPGDDVAARLAIIHHPTLFAFPPGRRLAIVVRKVVLVLNHPEVDAAGVVQYDLHKVAENIRFAFGVPPILAPIAPPVRASIRSCPPGAQLMERDWTYVIDLDRWPARGKPFPQAPVVIGRHSRPELVKWPDARETAEHVYPPRADIRIRMLGADRNILASSYGPLPANWECIPFGQEDPSEFLTGLDFYVYFHGESWIEAFGRNLLEALATGLVTIVPPHFEPTFGPAAVYAEARDVESVIDGFMADPEAYERQSRQARAFVEERFSLISYRARIDELAPGDTPPVPAPTRPRARPRVLMVTSNGIGLGHLTRLLAVADRLPKSVQPVFLTLSQAVRLVKDAGYLAEFIPFHRYLNCEPERWNGVLAEELHEALTFYRPRVVVFDGNAPYPGLMSALAGFPEIISVWMRRSMWSPFHAKWLEPSASFDAIIQPGELASAFDLGPTQAFADVVHHVPPILLVDPSSRLSREEARKALDVPEGRILVALQLGSGNNFSFNAIREAVVAALFANPGVEIVEFVSPAQDAAPSDGGPRHAVKAIYPSFRYAAGFDFAVSAAGYNSFHESLLGAIPTVFVPNEADEMDRQISRARFAELRGCGRLLRAFDLYAVAAVVDDMMDPGSRDRMRQACRELAVENGAGEAANFIADLARFIRTDRHPAA
jgi:hypothetical protein